MDIVGELGYDMFLMG